MLNQKTEVRELYQVCQVSKFLGPWFGLAWQLHLGSVKSTWLRSQVPVTAFHF